MTQPFIYATQLPTGYVKVGRGTTLQRAYAASTYHVGEVRILGVWPVEAHRIVAVEKEIHAFLWFCHVVRELFECAPETLCAAITHVVGAPRRPETGLEGVSFYGSKAARNSPYRDDWTPEMRAMAVERVRQKHAAKRRRKDVR